MTDLKLYNEPELMARMAEGDEAAFEAVFHHYVPQITPVITGIIRQDGPVKDIVQEIFLAIWVSREKMPLIQSPANWIFKMAFHRSYNWLKRQKIRTAGMDHLRLQDTADPASDQRLLLHEITRLLELAVDSLPAQAQRIYRLSRNEGLSNQEIAGALGLSVQTVKNSLVRSLKTIKTVLAKEGIIIPLLLINIGR